MESYRTRSRDGIRTGWKGTMAAILVTSFLSLCWAPGAEAQPYFANKGFLVDGGGAPTQGNTPYFVGQRYSDSSDGAWQLKLWNYAGAEVYDSDDPNHDHQVGHVGNPAFVSGSAVYFNGSVYAFGPYQSTQYGGLTLNALYVVLDPATFAETGSSVIIGRAINSAQTQGKLGLAAVVASGQIYVFMTGMSTGGPVVYASSDGWNWANFRTTGDPMYPVVQDAITFSDPKDGKTRIMVVLSQMDSNYMPLLPAVSIFDPETGIWGPVSPLPQGGLPNGTFGMQGSGWFGSWRTTQSAANGGCGTYTWNSGNTDSYLHGLGAVWTGSMDFLVHWYLDPTTGSWIFDNSGCQVDPLNQSNFGAMWWAGPMPGNLNRTPVALGPGYAKTTAGGCKASDDCLQQQMFELSTGFVWQSPTRFAFLETFNSDVWVPATSWQGKGTKAQGPWSYNPVDTSNPADPAFGNDPDIYQAMAGLVRINGIVMGPPPFPADPDWQTAAPNTAPWSGTSNVQLGDMSGTTSGTSGTFDMSMTAGVEGTMTAPFVQGKVGVSFDMGYSRTHSTSTSFTSSYTWTLGTTAQIKSTLGRQGWMLAHAPIIQPASYVATSARDPGPTGTYMGYTQMLLSVSDAQSAFWPYSITNPADVAYPMGFLLSGVKPMPASTDIQGWSSFGGGSMRDWSDTNSNDWIVIAGKKGGPGNGVSPLILGSLQTQAFVSSSTKGTAWSDSYTGGMSTSLRIGTKGNNVTTSVDLSFGYETEGSSSTSFQNNLLTTYQVPVFQGGYSAIQVQPYLLQAITYNAPWVPKGYKGPLPWAITWDVTYAVSGTAPTLGAPQTIQATAPPPGSASGRITGIAAPNDPPQKSALRKSSRLPVDKVRDDSYSISDGQLSYFVPGGTLSRVAMSADDFSVTKGATVSINGYKLYANIHKGIWSRSWNVWTYRSTSGLEKLILTLDFGAGTWDMNVSKIELGDRFAGLNKQAAVTLDLNGLYILTTRINHRMAYEWQADLSSLDQPIWVESINVSRDLAGKGQVKLNGRITDAVRRVGDTSVQLNGAAKDYPLMAKVENFMQKVTEKGILVYKDANSSLHADLKSGVWACQVDTDVFKHPLPFHHGDLQLALQVGGMDYFNASIHPDSWAMTLEYNGTSGSPRLVGSPSHRFH